MSPPDDPGQPSDYISPTRIATFEGLSATDAKSLATEAGWTEVTVQELDAPRSHEVAGYYADAITLLTVDGIVVEAWTG